MFENVLVPIDGNDAAERVGRWSASVAKGVGGSVKVLCVAEGARNASSILKRVRRSGPDDGEIANSRRTAEAFASGISSQDLPVDSDVAAGSPADQIISAAELLGADLIAMATRRSSTLALTVLGSTTHRVVRNSPVPVVVVNPQSAITLESSPDTPSQLFVPLDGSMLAERAVEPATALAGRIGAGLTFIRSVARAFESDDNVSAATRECDEYLAGFVAAAEDRGVDAESVTATSAPASAILNLANEATGGVIVMTPNGLSGFRRAVIGSVTEQVLRGATCPVIVIPLRGE